LRKFSAAPLQALESPIPFYSFTDPATTNAESVKKIQSPLENNSSGPRIEADSKELATPASGRHRETEGKRANNDGRPVPKRKLRDSAVCLLTTK
jgi:hypothetical protein